MCGRASVRASARARVCVYVSVLLCFSCLCLSWLSPQPHFGLSEAYTRHRTQCVSVCVCVCVCVRVSLKSVTHAATLLTRPWGPCQESQWRQSLHKVQLLIGQHKVRQSPPHLRDCLSHCPHLHTWRDRAVDRDGGGRTHEPVIENTGHDVMCVCLCACVCLYQRGTENKMCQTL